jgi:Rhamnan synthesis protein F
LKSVAFTYYSNSVSDIFVKNVESFLQHTGKYDSLIICSDIQIPSNVVREVCELIPAVRVSPIQDSLFIKRKFMASQDPTRVNPFLLSAFHYQNCSSITVFDSNLFFTSDIDMNRGPVQFFLTQDSVISPSLFKFKPSLDLAKAASSIIGGVNYTTHEIMGAFNYLVTNSLAFSNKVVETNSFIFSNPKASDQIKIEKLFAFDFLNLGKSSKFREISEIRNSHINKKKVKRLPFIKSKIKDLVYEFIDTINLSPLQSSTEVSQPPVINSNFLKYKNIKPDAAKIDIIYTKQVANHAERLEKILRTLGFKISSRLLSPNSPIGKSSLNLHIVMCPNVFYDFPPNYIAYQFEQAHSKWFTEEYFNKLNGAIEIWEYSEYNIQYFNGKFKKPHVYVPIGDLNVSADDLSQSRDIDVLFYGEFLNSPRRKQFLDEIRKHRNIEIVDGFTNHRFGSSITDLLKRTKVVLNHHYYENGQLEVVRLYEALSYGCKVVSEISIDDNFHSLPTFKYSNIDQALAYLDKAVSTYSVEKFARDSTGYVKNALSRLGFNFSTSNTIVDNIRSILISPRKKKIAVYVHLYYTEVWDEIQSYISNIHEDFDLYVNLVNDTYCQDTVYRIVDKYPSAKIFKSDNIGRDFGGFYTMLNYSASGQSDVSFLIHSKRSKTSNFNGGDQWRKDLLDSILGSPQIAASTISKIRSSKIGVVSSAKWKKSDPSQIGSNANDLSDLSSRLGYDYSNYPLEFTAGSILAVKTSLLEDIFKSLSYSDFRPGDQIDGTMAHALERFIPNYALHKKYELNYV